ncbi:MAG: hypothetical protein IPK76_18115 [Lewinellaceae bacterium]|nr:hypothetical protein [Lewinellaceae bacterium]
MIRKLLFLCLLTIVAQAVSAQKTTLQGVVKDAESGQPLSDAAVVVTGSGQVAATDNEGRFKLPD